MKFFTNKSIVRRFERFDAKSLFRNKSNVVVMIIFSVISLLLMSGKFGGTYVDGIYEGFSKAMYVTENYYGKTRITIKDGYIAKVEFQIIDSTKREKFDEKYERYFTGNQEYIDQCRNDFKGMKAYPEKLVKYQELKNVDAISGATWSYNLFRYSVYEALKKAKKS